MPADQDITKEEFIARFKAEMFSFANGDPQNVDHERYATQAAEAAWDEPNQREEGPEECARTDVSYWDQSA